MFTLLILFKGVPLMCIGPESLYLDPTLFFGQLLWQDRLRSTLKLMEQYARLLVSYL